MIDSVDSFLLGTKALQGDGAINDYDFYRGTFSTGCALGSQGLSLVRALGRLTDAERIFLPHQRSRRHLLTA